MGNGESKLISEQITRLQDKINGLTENVSSIQNTISTLPTDYILRSELDSKLTKVEEDAAISNSKLAQLLELTREQQEVIMELGTRYTELFDDYQTQQETIQSIATRCDERLSKQEEELAGTRSKLVVIEKGVIENSELTKMISIRKNENMIKKETASPVRNLRKTSITTKRADERFKFLDKNQVTRGQKKVEKEKKSETKEGVKSKAKENEPINEQENQPNFLDIIMNDKKEVLTGQSGLKETLTEVDMNTLL